VKAQVNHRVNVASDHVELQERIAKTLLPVVRRYNLTLVGFDDEILHHGIPTSKVLLSSGGGQGKYLDPAPISPTDATDPASSWTLLSSTARGVWASRPEVSVDGTLADLDAGKDLVVAPYMSTGVSRLARGVTRLMPEHRYGAILGSDQIHLPIQVCSIRGDVWRTHNQRAYREPPAWRTSEGLHDLTSRMPTAWSS
jgi:Gly-Xaa carboxypeptidase